MVSFSPNSVVVWSFLSMMVPLSSTITMLGLSLCSTSSASMVVSGMVFVLPLSWTVILPNGFDVMANR